HALFLQLEDGLEVHLSGVDGIIHFRAPPASKCYSLRTTDLRGDSAAYDVPRRSMQGELMRTLVMWDEALLAYNLGDHPLDPVRVELTVALARALGVLDRDGVRV